MYIKQLNKNHFDVFLGNGWNNWTRIRRNHWGVSYICGTKLTRDTIHELNQRIIK